MKSAKTLEPGFFISTRRARKGGLRVVLDAAVMVRDFRPSLPFVTVLTSRPAWAGAPRRQFIPAGQFLSLARLDGASAGVTQAMPEVRASEGGAA